jgi:PD-(D/E)XK nuclease superfamily
MIQTKEVDKNLIEAAFYEKPFKFSYSSLNRLLTAPNIFYKEYVLKQREIKTEKYLLEGTLIHYLLLDNRAFDEKFLVTPENLPSANSMKVAHAIFDIYIYSVDQDPAKEELELCDFPEEIMKVLGEMKLHQSVKEENRLAKIVEPKTEEYFKYLKKKGQREIIDSGMLDKCTRAADVLKVDPQIRELLGMDLVSDGVNYGVYNELELDMELEGMPFGLKGILDNMVVDVANKTIRINDFKTTGKSLVDFPDSVEFWNYWLQAAIYLMLAMEYLKSVIDDTWKFEVRFIVFDKYDQLYAYPVGNDTMAIWITKMWEVLKEALYHYDEKDFTLPYRFVAGEVSL